MTGVLPLDDCLYALQPSIPHLTRSALPRGLQRHGISRVPDIEGDKALLNEVEGRSYLWANGQAEQMNRTSKEATVKHFHYKGHAQLRTHLADGMAAYKCARRLKTLRSLRSII